MNQIPEHYQGPVVTMYSEKRSRGEELPTMPITTARAVVQSFLDNVPRVGELSAAEMKDLSMAEAFRSIQEQVGDQAVLDNTMAITALSISKQISMQRDFAEIAGDTDGSSQTDQMSWIAGTWLDAANSLMSQEK